MLEINVDLFNTDEKQVTKIKTGFWGIDNLIGGLKPGDIFVIRARPGKGKSTLAINIASRISSGSNGIKSRVLYFSLEMTNKEIASKILSSYTKINGRKIINNTLDDTETETVCNAYSVTSKYDLYIDDKAGATLSYIRNKINTVKPNVVVIDHIGLIKSENQRFSKYEQLNEISNSLKCIAKDTKTAIIELCQLNREIEGRKNKVPLMRDLRDSGSIEQDADNILLIESDDSETELYRCSIFHLLKVRHGRTGKVQMRFLPEFSLFKDTEQ